MQVQVEDLSPVSKKLSFVVEADKVSGKLDEAYKTLSKQVQMKGFRPGKVPRRILEKRFGRHIEGEVGGQVISDAFDEAIEEHDITPVSQPIIEQGKLVKGEDYSFSVTIEIKPKLVLEGWEGVDVEWERVELDEAGVEEELEQMRQRAATVEAADEGHEAVEGDMVIVDGTFTVEGAEPRKLEGLMVLAGQTTGMASADWLSGQVVGLAVGATKSETVTPPEGALGEEWDDKEGLLELHVTEIKTTRLPELDDDFAQDVGHDTLELLRADLRFKLEEHMRAHVRGHAAQNAIKAVLAKNEFEVPQGLVRYQAEQSLKEQFQQFARQGLSGLKLPTLGDLPEETQQGLLDDATFAVKQGLVLEAIADAAEIEITDEDLDAKIAEMAAEIGQQPSAVKGLLLKNNGLEGLRSRLLEERALDTLLERANVIDVDPTDHSHADHGDHDHDHAEAPAAEDAEAVADAPEADEAPAAEADEAPAAEADEAPAPEEAKAPKEAVSDEG